MAETRQISGTIRQRPGGDLAPRGAAGLNALFIIDSILFWLGRTGRLPRTDVRAEPRTQHCISARLVSGPWLESCAMCHAYQHICAQVSVVAFYAYNFIACAMPQCICICEPQKYMSYSVNRRSPKVSPDRDPRMDRSGVNVRLCLAKCGRVTRTSRSGF